MQMLAGGPEIIFLTWLLLLALWLQQFSQPRRFVAATTSDALAVSAGGRARHFASRRRNFCRSSTWPRTRNGRSGFADLRWSMPGRGWVNFLVPMAFGTTHTEGIFFQHGQYWTSSYYLGVGTLWLALLAVVACANAASGCSVAHRFGRTWSSRSAETRQSCPHCKN